MSGFAADGLGLVVPINVEALCVNDQTGPVFQPSPYDFAKLANRSEPYISATVMTLPTPVRMPNGVHLHWALPDGITKGQAPQDTSGQVRFPATPDRWLVSRVFTDLSDPQKPVNRVKCWVVESNYLSIQQPGDSVAVPFRTEKADEQQYRFLGRVQEFEAWREQFIQQRQNGELPSQEFVGGLSAVGYGTPEFSASYQLCKSVFGFTDKQADMLAAAGSGADGMLVSYHVVGWHHDLANDPLTQLPLQLDPPAFTALLEKVINPEDKQRLEAAYQIMQPDGPYILVGNPSGEEQFRLYQILSSAGLDFLTALLERCQWSLPSGALETKPAVTHTLFCGVVGPVFWSPAAKLDDALNDQVNIAVGNTASEALAALIASLAEIKNQPAVELLLDALQLGQLNGVTDAKNLNRMETLALALHQNGYRSTDGGDIWQVSLLNDADKGSGEVTLPESIADELNTLNTLQADFEQDDGVIRSLRQEIFWDWYRFMQVLHQNADPNIQPSALQTYIMGEIDALNARVQAHTHEEIDALAAKIRAELPKEYELTQVTGPRFWQPLEPVVLFQGESIRPPQRYGGNGRFMANKTMVCRLSSQVITSLTAPANVLGNSQQLVVDAANTPQLPASVPLDYSQQVHALFTESSLLNPSIVAALVLSAGSTLTFAQLQAALESATDGFVTPPVAPQLTAAAVTAMRAIISLADYDFFLTLYAEAGEVFQLKKPASELTDDEVKRLRYLFISASAGWGTPLVFAGIAPSLVYFVRWEGKNPWLPFSLTWNVTYYPFEPIGPGANGDKQYAPDFILNTFGLGDVNYEHRGPVSVPPQDQSYTNFIFMTPHAEENFQTQIRKFLDANPESPLDEEMKAILAALKNFPPILSQSLNGLNDSMTMLNEVLQLQVKDPTRSAFARFSNVIVPAAVGAVGQSAPAPDKYYNPIRAGVMRFTSLKIVDVFGRNIKIDMPNNVIIARTLKADGLQANFIYLTPRISQAARLSFRWLAADNRALEMNTHPATTPVCGWLLANHLEESLWLYDNRGHPLGSLILTEDSARVIWQGTPGEAGFGMSIEEFFSTGPGKDVNAQFKRLALALYNGSDSAYLRAFMAANDNAFTLVQPENFKQLGSTAVLIGAPIAVAQARLDLDLPGRPAFNMSWKSLEKEVNEGRPKTDNGFSQVEFPVRLGAMEQVNDGLLGYFVEDNYDHYYALDPAIPNDKVTAPTEKTVTLTADPKTKSVLVTLLFDPRGSVHATSGVLPVKEISVPPDLYADALEALQIAFLTTPILTSMAKLSFPTPSIGGGKWTWLQNDFNQWSEAQEIAPADDSATMSYSPQKIQEGWLVLKRFIK
jgi:hypothetical protein